MKKKSIRNFIFLQLIYYLLGLIKTQTNKKQPINAITQNGVEINIHCKKVIDCGGVKSCNVLKAIAFCGEAIGVLKKTKSKKIFFFS